MIKIYKVNKEQPDLLDQLNKKKSFGTVLIYSDHCPHCVSMKPQWEQMKNKVHNKPANIYEINSEDLPYINHPIKNVVDGYPMILNVNDRNIVPFEQERTLNNFIRFVESNIVNHESKKKKSYLDTKHLIQGNQIENSLNLEKYKNKKLPSVRFKKTKTKPKRSQKIRTKMARNKSEKNKRLPLRKKTSKKRKM